MKYYYGSSHVNEMSVQLDLTKAYNYILLNNDSIIKSCPESFYNYNDIIYTRITSNLTINGGES